MKAFYPLLFFSLLASFGMIPVAWNLANPETPSPKFTVPADGTCDSIVDLIVDPSCIGRTVTIPGEVNFLREKTSEKGNQYWLFDLVDEEGNSIPCFSWEDPTGQEEFSGVWDFNRFGDLQLEISQEEGLENSVSSDSFFSFSSFVIVPKPEKVKGRRW